MTGGVCVSRTVFEMDVLSVRFIFLLTCLLFVVCSKQSQALKTLPLWPRLQCWADSSFLVTPPTSGPLVLPQQSYCWKLSAYSPRSHQIVNSWYFSLCPQPKPHKHSGSPCLKKSHFPALLLLFSPSRMGKNLALVLTWDASCIYLSWVSRVSSNRMLSLQGPGLNSHSPFDSEKCQSLTQIHLFFPFSCANFLLRFEKLSLIFSTL